MTTEKTKTHTHITLLIDRSGSMQTLRSDVVGGINAYVAEQATQPGKCRVTVIQFDGQDPHEVVRECKIAEWVPMTDADFTPRGMTPLRDAMARAIHAVERKDKTQEIFVVMTDGQENASREISAADLKALVSERITDEWLFVYLGANQDAIDSATQVGIPRANVENFAGDGQGVGATFSSAAGLTSNVRKSRRRGMSVNVSNAYESTGSAKGAEDDLASRT